MFVNWWRWISLIRIKSFTNRVWLFCAYAAHMKISSKKIHRPNLFILCVVYLCLILCLSIYLFVEKLRLIKKSSCRIIYGTKSTAQQQQVDAKGYILCIIKKKGSFLFSNHARSSLRRRSFELDESIDFSFPDECVCGFYWPWNLCDGFLFDMLIAVCVRVARAGCFLIHNLLIFFCCDFPLHQPQVIYDYIKNTYKCLTSFEFSRISQVILNRISVLYAWVAF